MKYFNQDKIKGACTHADCEYQSANEGAFFRHVEGHNLIYVCTCSYYSSVRDSTNRHIRKAHDSNLIQITQVDRRHWAEARTLIKGLPHRMPRLPASSKANFKATRDTSSVDAAKITDIRYKLTESVVAASTSKVPPLSIQKSAFKVAKPLPLRIPHKEMPDVQSQPAAVKKEVAKPPLVQKMVRPFSIEKATPGGALNQMYKIPKKSAVSYSSSSNWRRPNSHRGSIMEEIRRREERTARLRALLREEEAEIEELRQLRDTM